MSRHLHTCSSAELVSALIFVSSLLCINSDVMIDVIFVMAIRMQSHKCNKLKNASSIFNESRLVGL